MNKKISKILKDKIHEEIADSIYKYGPKHKCIDLRDKYVPKHVGSSSFYRWVIEIKAGPPSKKMMARAHQWWVPGEAQ